MCIKTSKIDKNGVADLVKNSQLQAKSLREALSDVEHAVFQCKREKDYMILEANQKLDATIQSLQYQISVKVKETADLNAQIEKLTKP